MGSKALGHVPGIWYFTGNIFANWLVSWNISAYGILSYMYTHIHLLSFSLSLSILPSSPSPPSLCLSLSQYFRTGFALYAKNFPNWKYFQYKHCRTIGNTNHTPSHSNFNRTYIWTSSFFNRWCDHAHCWSGIGIKWRRTYNVRTYTCN